MHQEIISSLHCTVYQIVFFFMEPMLNIASYKTRNIFHCLLRRMIPQVI